MCLSPRRRPVAPAPKAFQLTFWVSFPQARSIRPGDFFLPAFGQLPPSLRYPPRDRQPGPQVRTSPARCDPCLALTGLRATSYDSQDARNAPKSPVRASHEGTRLLVLRIVRIRPVPLARYLRGETTPRPQKIVETLHRVEIKHAIDVRNFHQMQSFHAIAGRRRVLIGTVLSRAPRFPLAHKGTLPKRRLARCERPGSRSAAPARSTPIALRTSCCYQIEGAGAPA